jgi:hypothetical protein
VRGIVFYLTVTLLLIAFWDNFTKEYLTIHRFEKMVLNYQTSVSKFLNVSLKDTPLGFAVKSYQNFQNAHFSLSTKKKMVGFRC